VATPATISAAPVGRNYQPQYSRMLRGWTATMPWQPPQSWKTASLSGTTAPTPTRTWGPRSGTR
jgi:hypothetical protein